MKNNIVIDERVQALKRKITNEAFQLLMLFLLGSILVKQFVLRIDFLGYSTEFIAFFGASFYILIRNIFVGNKIFLNEEKKNKSIIINSLINGVVITAVIAIIQYSNSEISEGYGVTLIVGFLVSTLSTFLIYMIISWVNQKRIKKIEEQFEDDDEV
ncbi:MULTISPECIES: DUF6773 family protein [Bacillus]|uniref:DUF6773 family protein n=1 Tax=Bacillus TaxID=1386 RepID=UPI0021CF3D14|nr:DUF6773 family protein [Bacillus wiedmannii]MCU5331957.1 hypothetical protein [Bacillus wiedmannii]